MRAPLPSLSHHLTDSLPPFFQFSLVPQVSAAQLGTLAKLAAGTLEAGDRMSTDEPAGNGAGAGLEELTMEDFR